MLQLYVMFAFATFGIVLTIEWPTRAREWLYAALLGAVWWLFWGYVLLTGNDRD